MEIASHPFPCSLGLFSVRTRCAPAATILGSKQLFSNNPLLVQPFGLKGTDSGLVKSKLSHYGERQPYFRYIGESWRGTDEAQAVLFLKPILPLSLVAIPGREVID